MGLREHITRCPCFKEDSEFVKRTLENTVYERRETGERRVEERTHLTDEKRLEEEG